MLCHICICCQKTYNLPPGHYKSASDFMVTYVPDVLLYGCLYTVVIYVYNIYNVHIYIYIYSYTYTYIYIYIYKYIIINIFDIML